jgi:hypothetical protein
MSHLLYLSLAGPFFKPLQLVSWGMVLKPVSKNGRHATASKSPHPGLTGSFG